MAAAIDVAEGAHCAGRSKQFVGKVQRVRMIIHCKGNVSVCDAAYCQHKFKTCGDRIDNDVS